jgi:hypothetical protein
MPRVKVPGPVDDDLLIVQAQRRKAEAWREAHPDGPAEPETGAPLPPMIGDLAVPPWAIRPGAFPRLAKYAPLMPLWLAIYSRSGDFHLPCYASRESLAATIGRSRSEVARQLKKLEKCDLMFSLDRGYDRVRNRQRPPARWALNPLSADGWCEKIPAVIERIAADDRQGGGWKDLAIKSFGFYQARVKKLANDVVLDLPQKLQKTAKEGRRPRRPMPRPAVHCGPGGEGMSGVEGGPKAGKVCGRTAAPTAEHPDQLPIFGRPSDGATAPETRPNPLARNGIEGAAVHGGPQVRDRSNRLPQFRP